MRPVELTLFTKPGCHLCDDARAAVTEVVARLERGAGLEVAIVERNILEDAALQERYGEEIPVVLLDGTMHSYWRVDPVRLQAALITASQTALKGRS